MTGGGLFDEEALQWFEDVSELPQKNLRGKENRIMNEEYDLHFFSLIPFDHDSSPKKLGRFIHWLSEPFALDKKMSATIASKTIGSEKVLLVKPDTFMNHSGVAVQALLQFYKLSPADIAVIHDDLDIAPGTYKTTVSSRAAGHNGVQDIIDTLGTQDFFRIRIGIGHPTEVLGACMPAHDFVLQNFSPEELAALTGLFPKIKEDILLWLKA
jgi:PTH1 family peptidyl-tRNA hydrolase